MKHETMKNNKLKMMTTFMRTIIIYWKLKTETEEKEYTIMNKRILTSFFFIVITMKFL